jgi:hypothetical protein
VAVLLLLQVREAAMPEHWVLLLSPDRSSPEHAELASSADAALLCRLAGAWHACKLLIILHA